MPSASKYINVDKLNKRYDRKVNPFNKMDRDVELAKIVVWPWHAGRKKKRRKAYVLIQGVTYFQAKFHQKSSICLCAKK